MQYSLTSTLVATTLLLSSSTVVLAAPLQLDLSQLQHVDVTNPLGVGPQIFPTRHEDKEKRRVISTGVFHGQLPKTGEFETLPIVNKKDKRDAEPVFPGQYDDPKKQGWAPYFGNQQVDGSKRKMTKKREAEALELLPGMKPVNPEGCDDPFLCASLKKEKREAEAEAEALELLPGMEPINPEGCDDPLLCASLKEKREAEAEAEALELLPGMKPVNPEGCDDPFLCASLKKEKREAEAEAEAEALQLLPGMEPIDMKKCTLPECVVL
ncbi:hypothetical protein SMMN14_01742 [Sphaerulina musiva]